MAKYSINDTTLTQIADSIRSKTNTTADIKVSDFASKINSITTGSSAPVVSGTKLITSTSKVDVSSYQYAQVSDTNLLPYNIRAGVTILGIDGNYATWKGTEWKFRQNITWNEVVRYWNTYQNGESSGNITLPIYFATGTSVNDIDGENGKAVFTHVRLSYENSVGEELDITSVIDGTTYPIAYISPNNPDSGHSIPTYSIFLLEEPTAAALSFLQAFAEEQ